MTIAERIFYLLASDGREQKDLANAIGVTPQTVSAWKARGTSPGAEHISSIAEYLGVSTDYLLTGEERQLRLKDEDVELLNLWDGLSKADRAFIKYEMYKRSGKDKLPDDEQLKATDENGNAVGLTDEQQELAKLRANRALSAYISEIALKAASEAFEKERKNSD